MKIREGVADALVAEGVEVVFALMGDGNQDLICDLGERCGARIVHGRHEQGVVDWATDTPDSAASRAWPQ